MDKSNRELDQEALLGNRLRAARVSMGMTLEELARKVRVTRSFLSQVERGVSSPSLTTLRHLANELGVPVFLLFNEGASPRNALVRKKDRRNLILPNATTYYQLLSPDLNRRIEMIITKLEAGSASCEEPLPHPGEECALLLRGRVRIEVGDEVFILEEGDTLYFDATLPHRIANLGGKTAEIVSAISPPSF